MATRAALIHSCTTSGLLYESKPSIGQAIEGLREHGRTGASKAQSGTLQAEPQIALYSDCKLVSRCDGSETVMTRRGGCTMRVQCARCARLGVVHGPVGSLGAVVMANAIHGA